jgi:5-methyltetrahydropteroyltriglutamate--homocysteine methyltransferase
MAEIHRAEIIGSLLRPAYLMEGRAAWQAGRLTLARFKQIEDRAIDEALELQTAAGIDVVTDGEMRRLAFLGPLMELGEGVAPVSSETYHWKRTEGETESQLEFANPYSIVGKIRRTRSSTVEEYVYARARSRLPIKVTLPSPLLLTMAWSRRLSGAAYPDPFSLFWDAAAILRDEVRDLAAVGCEYIQIDAPEFAQSIGNSIMGRQFAERGVTLERMLSEGIAVLNAIADCPGVTFGLHTCRGNLRGHWLAEGGYEEISKHIFRRASAYEVFLLEYDDWRSGSFAALADIPTDKRVVLGLVSTKHDSLETADALLARIDEASRCFPRQQLAISPQCGFATTADGNPISAATQAAKLRLIGEVARRAWG